MLMSLNDSIHKYKLNNEATSNIKIYQVLSSLSLSDLSIYLRDGPFESDIEMVNLHPSEGTQWVAYVNGNYFDSCGCVCPKKPSRITIKRNGCCLYFDFKMQSLTNKRHSYFASYCL